MKPLDCSRLSAAVFYGTLLTLGFVAFKMQVPGTVVIAFVAAFPVLLWILSRCEDESGEVAMSPLLRTLETQTVEDAAVQTSSPGKGRREYFLDNLKVFLTFLVVLHHTCCAFGTMSWYYCVGVNKENQVKNTVGLTILTLNQSYFMCLFFFISGYFVPASYKKGRRKFIEGKMKRLGLPLYLFAFVVYPLLMFTMGKYFSTGSAEDKARAYTFPMPEAGPAWYIMWLLCFCAVFLTIRKDEHEPVPAKPNLSECIKWGFFAGLVQGIILIYFPKMHSFGAMTITFGSLPLDILFFVAGTKARNGNWLSYDAASTEWLLTKEQRKVVTWVVLGCGGYVAIAGTCVNYNLYIPPSYFYGFWILLSGPFAVCVSLLEIDWFQRHFDYQTPRTAWLAQSAYMVYLFHPWVLVVFTYVYVYILQAGFGIDLPFDMPYGLASVTVIDNGLLWAGFISVGVVTQLVVWPLSWLLRKLPGIRNVF
eukprot:Stramenopile-MAST_4_protein_1570